jgi:hypothetical protein
MRLLRKSSDQNGPGGTAFEPQGSLSGEHSDVLEQDFNVAVQAAGGELGGGRGKPAIYMSAVVDGESIPNLWVPSAMADRVESELTKRRHTIEKGQGSS